MSKEQTSEPKNHEALNIGSVGRSACGNCKNFTKRTKRTGTCSIHKAKLKNLKNGILEERLLTVFKYHLCEHYVGDMCPSHKPKHQNDYIGWHLWAEKQTAKGIEQKKCEKCKRWFFPSEF